MDIKELALKLALCESEAEIITVLEDMGVWNDASRWRPFGDNENNWSTIGNQQSEPDPALVEKIINSIDSLLEKECLLRKINPESLEAPQSIAEALEKYFSIRNGKIQDLTASIRTELARNIMLAATGAKPVVENGKRGFPNLTLVDKGEGQTPNKMPYTILSINKSNKLKVPFVQGKFNMGGTGVLRFCGENNFQLIISKRCPEIEDKNDESKDYWGVTIVRRERPENGRRSSVYTYLVDTNQEVIRFKADKMRIIPSTEHVYMDMEYGMFCKLFEYKMPSRLCSNINMALYSRLSTLMPNLAYPVMLNECRDYSGHSLSRTLSGLNVRISDQLQRSKESVEANISCDLTIDQQHISMSVFVFDKSFDMSTYRNSEGIILTQNGQTHGSFDKRFYKRSSVGLSYLSDSILAIVDCSKIDEKTREDLFMNSRDRMSVSSFSTKLEERLEEFFKNNEQLRLIQAQRREEAITGRLDDSKPLEDVLKSVFKASPVLSRLFVTGERLNNPTGSLTRNLDNNFIGKVNPTYFKLEKQKKDHKYKKLAQIGRQFRVRLLTDAENSFFSREEYPGRYELLHDGIICNNHSLHLFNGIATLNVELPEDAEVGKCYSYEMTIYDTMIDAKHNIEFDLEIIEMSESPGSNGGRRDNNGGDKGNDKLGPNGISMPNVIEVYENSWTQYSFDRESALCVVGTDAEGVYDFFVNMDNIHLQMELKPIARSAEKIRLLKARYKYGMVLIGLSVLGYFEKQKDIDREGKVAEYSKLISPMLLPMIDVLGDNMFDILQGSEE